MRLSALALVFSLAAACQSGETNAAFVPPRPSSYESVIAPILQQRCVGCHGAERAKGGLRLHTPVAIRAGGASGASLVAGDPASSELVRRLHLPLADEEHMPPDDKPQPEPTEIAALERWIAAGAPFEGEVEGLSVPARKPQPAASIVPPADPAALARLRAELVHVQPLSAASTSLWIDFAAIAPRAQDALVTELLAALRPQVAELALARSPVGAGTLAFCATLPGLTRLDLRDTRVGDAELARLGAHPRVEELVLARTAITDASVDQLLSLPKLRHVYLWGCALSAESVARLRARPGLAVDFGDMPDAAIAQVEDPPKFTSDLPIPDLPPAGDPNAPVNAACPVTGSPINPKYTRTFEGRVFAFCCPNCPGEFDSDPAKYAAKFPGSR